MIFFLPENWTIRFFPRTTLLLNGSVDLPRTILLLLVALSLFYLLVMWLAARFCTTRRLTWGTKMTGVYMILILLSCFAIAARARGAVYTPFYQIVSFFLLQAGMLVSFAGSWLIHRQVADDPLLLADFVRGGYWFSLLTTPLLWLVFFLQVPVVEAQDHTIFWGPVVLALLLYFLLNSLVVHWGHILLNLKVSSSGQSCELGGRYHSLKRFVADRGGYPLILLGPGIRNAVALHPQQWIFVGQDLLLHLTDQEIKAILLHEIGHLKDRKYMVLRHRLSQVLPFVMVAWIVLEQADIFAIPVIMPGILVMGLIIFSVVFKRLRLKGEFVADRYVKEQPGNYYPALLSGIDRVARLNGLDRDFCKRHDYAHLDLDERRDMVEKGRFYLQRKRSRRFILTMFFFMILGMAFQYGWMRMFPPPAKQWSNMHRKFHRLVHQGNLTDAASFFDRVLSFSIEQFGETSRRTYLLYRDCANLRLYQENIAGAEQCLLRATNIGEQLYGRQYPGRITELRILARIRKKQGKEREAETIMRHADALAPASE